MSAKRGAALERGGGFIVTQKELKEQKWVGAGTELYLGSQLGVIEQISKNQTLRISKQKSSTEGSLEPQTPAVRHSPSIKGKGYG